MVAAVFLASRLLALAPAQVSAMTRLTNSAPMALGINGVGTSLLPPYLLDDFDVDPETKRVLGVALEKTRVFLGLADDFADGIIAKRLIELAKAGECNPICYARAQSTIAGAFVRGLTGRSYTRPTHRHEVDGPGLATCTLAGRR